MKSDDVRDIAEKLDAMHDIHVGYVQDWAEESVNARVVRDAASEIRALRSELAELRAENDKLAYWNSAVAVCKDHVEEIVTATYGLCVLCDMDKLERELAELRGRGAGPLAVEGDARVVAICADCGAKVREADPWAHIGTPAWLRRLADTLPDKVDADALRCHADTEDFRDREWLAMRDRLGIAMHVRVDDWLAAHPSVSAGERRIEGRVGFCAHCLHPASSHDDMGCWHVPRGSTDVCGCAEYVDSHATSHDSAVLPTPTEPAT